MQTAELQFNIIYTPGTVRYLSPFIVTLLEWSDCRYRIVANGCSDTECQLLEEICARDARLELLVMPEKRMVPHGETLDFLHARTDSDYFCFMDSDILATGAFLEEFKQALDTSEVFSSCLPLWHRHQDITIPDYFDHMHGIHAYTADGKTIACDYFVVYNNKAYVEAKAATGMGLAVCAWQDLSPENQQTLAALGQQKSDYDSGKVLTLLMAARGSRIEYRQSDKLKHIGGFTEVGAIEGALLYTRGTADEWASKFSGPTGRAAFAAADAWYAWRRGPGQNSYRENYSLASRIRRRTATARYFYLLIVGLMDDLPVPAIPNLGDTAVEQQLRTVSQEISVLITRVRTEAGPWQDAALQRQ